GGHDDRACLHRSLLGQCDLQGLRIGGTLRTQQLSGDQGDGHLSAELLCLIERSTGECLSRNARRKAEAVLNSRGGSRLATQHFRIKDQNGETFGGSVYSRRQTSRPRSDDRDIVDLPST